MKVLKDFAVVCLYSTVIGMMLYVAIIVALNTPLGQ